MRLLNEFVHTIEIERSRFICYLKKTMNEEEAKSFIQNIRKSHPDANHHCTAFLMGQHDELQRCNDDGEPSGTAGVPMLSALKNSNIHDITAVVVRYFGGIKLGAGGLVRAYTKSVSEAIQAAPKVETVSVFVYSFQFSYDLIGKIDYLLKECVILNKQYEEQVSYQFYAEDDSILLKIQECTSGQYVPQLLERRIIEREIQ